MCNQLTSHVLTKSVTPTQYIEWFRKEKRLAVFLDLTVAYDPVWSKGLLTKLGSENYQSCSQHDRKQIHQCFLGNKASRWEETKSWIFVRISL